MTSFKSIKYKQFNEVYQVKACKVRQTFNTLTNPQARRLLKEVWRSFKTSSVRSLAVQYRIITIKCSDFFSISQTVYL